MVRGVLGKALLMLVPIYAAMLMALLSTAAYADLVDHGGAVMSDIIRAYMIYWTPSGVVLDNTVTGGTGNFQTLNQQFYNDVATSGYMNIVRGYPGTCSGSPCLLSNTAGSVTLGGAWVDTQAYPDHGNSATAGTQANPLTDADIQAEVTRAITQNAWSVDANAIFIVVTGVFSSSGNPVEECNGSNCTFGGSAFCAYHSYFGSTPTIYSYLSDASFMRGGCNEGLSSAVNGQISSDREVALMTHEFIEAVTDPQLGTWWEPVTGAEIGDKCNQIPATVTLSGNSYAVQQQWSNFRGSCVSNANSAGDTHMTTFNGLFYDFQAYGDFVEAEVDPDLVVQTRKVSSAPTWPNASVNRAVATRMGNTKVAICLAPPGMEVEALLNIDGEPTNLGDGKSLSLSDGVDISRRGNIYVIADLGGDSVTAEVHSSWINVAVGLGGPPEKVHGLLANANENVNRIAARDGTVLTMPFSFEDLYHRYADSWRVPANESLLSVCGGRGTTVEQGIPERAFYAKDLDPEVYKRTRAVCTAAGVKAEPLLDACTLDVAVLGSDEAAKVFVGAPAPVAVGIVTGPSTSGGGKAGPGLKLWLLLLVIFLVAALMLWILIRRRKS